VCFQSYSFLAERIPSWTLEKLCNIRLSFWQFSSNLYLISVSKLIRNLRKYETILKCVFKVIHFLVRRESVCRTLLTRKQITFETHFKFVSLFLRFLEQKSVQKKMTGCYTTSQEFRKKHALQETNNFENTLQNCFIFPGFLINFETKIKCVTKKNWQKGI